MDRLLGWPQVLGLQSHLLSHCMSRFWIRALGADHEPALEAPHALPTQKAPLFGCLSAACCAGRSRMSDTRWSLF